MEGKLNPELSGREKYCPSRPSQLLYIYCTSSLVAPVRRWTGVEEVQRVLRGWKVRLIAVEKCFGDDGLQ